MEELTRLRVEQGWSQQRLADESGVNKATINQIERGRRSPNVETLEKLANALGVGVADFFPKAQAPLWSDEPPERRLTLDYDACAEAINGFCDRWESKLAAKQIDRRDLQEFRRTGKLIAGTFGVVWEFQIDELRAELGREPTLEEPGLWSVVDRYTNLLIKMRDFEYENFDGATLKEASVTSMERFRRKEAG